MRTSKVRHAVTVLSALLLAAGLVTGCRSRPDGGAPDSRRTSGSAGPEQGSEATTDRGPQPSRPGGQPRIVFLGDSLTAGLGLGADEAYPAELQRRIDAERLGYDVVNAGVSGDTTAGGRSRLSWALDGDVRVLVLALGANDGLRGLSVSEMERNLRAIIEQARGRRIQVLLAGMESPTNMGPEYRREFREVFPRLAREYPGTAFVPFLLEGVAGRPDLNQPDGIHPTAAGARIMADHVWAALKPLLAKTAS